LISRRRSVIVIATGAGGRRRPLESRVRSAASRTIATTKTVVPDVTSWLTNGFTADFVSYFGTYLSTRFTSRFASNFGALRTLAAPASVSRLSATSTTTTTSAKIPRTARGVTRRFGGNRFRFVPLVRDVAGFGKLPVAMSR
jgi:hypothetical protein